MIISWKEEKSLKTWYTSRYPNQSLLLDAEYNWTTGYNWDSMIQGATELINSAS